MPVRHVGRTLTKHPKCFQSPNLIWWGGGDRRQHRFLPYTFVGSDSIPKEEQKEINKRLPSFFLLRLSSLWRGQWVLYFCNFFFSFPSRDYTYESQGLHSDITTPPTQVFFGLQVLLDERPLLLCLVTTWLFFTTDSNIKVFSPNLTMFFFSKKPVQMSVNARCISSFSWEK